MKAARSILITAQNPVAEWIIRTRKRENLVKNCFTRLNLQNLSRPKRKYGRPTLCLPVNKYPSASYGMVDAKSITNHVDKYLSQHF